MSTSDLTNQEKLEETYKLTLENNEILHKLQNRDRITMIFRTVYWLAILGTLGGVYYYIHPLLNSFASHGTRAESLIQQFQQLRSQFPETRAVQDILDQLHTNITSTSSATGTQ